MTAQPRLIVAELPELRPSVRIAKLAEAWDCDVSQIMRLIAEGEIEAHGLGTRAVRVFIDSANAYQERRTREPKERSPKKPARGTARPVDSAAHRAAMAELHRHGIG